MTAEKMKRPPGSAVGALVYAPKLPEAVSQTALRPALLMFVSMRVCSGLSFCLLPASSARSFPLSRSDEAASVWIEPHGLVWRH
jgi:hypothetical protein